jgi:hypothetical protein
MSLEETTEFEFNKCTNCKAIYPLAKFKNENTKQLKYYFCSGECNLSYYFYTKIARSKNKNRIMY